MNKEQKIAAIDFAIDALQKKKEKIVADAETDPYCEPGFRWSKEFQRCIPDPG